MGRSGRNKWNENGWIFKWMHAVHEYNQSDGENQPQIQVPYVGQKFCHMQMSMHMHINIDQRTEIFFNEDASTLFFVRNRILKLKLGILKFLAIWASLVLIYILMFVRIQYLWYQLFEKTPIKLIFLQNCVKNVSNDAISLKHFSKLKLGMFFKSSKKFPKIDAPRNLSSLGDVANNRHPCRGTAKSLNNSKCLNESDVTS